MEESVTRQCKKTNPIKEWNERDEQPFTKDSTQQHHSQSNKQVTTNLHFAHKNRSQTDVAFRFFNRNERYQG